MSLWNTYRGVENALENDKPLLFRLLDENIDWGKLIPYAFYRAFYKRFGRSRGYHLESFLRMLLKPVLQDFRAAHPTLRYGSFAGDATFDSYDNYSFLLKEYGFKKAVVPINARNGVPCGEVGFNENGTPICPKDGKPFAFHGNCSGNGRTERLNRYLVFKVVRH